MEARILDLQPDPETDPEAFYHPHEEDSVPVSGMHDAIVLYLESVLGVHLSPQWVASDLCCYWIPGDNRTYLAPDVFVAERETPAPLPSSFRLWTHGPLRLVVEVGSRTSLRRDVGPKLERYAEGLWPDEYLYYDADHLDLRLHRRVGRAYERVTPDAEGRLWSEATGLGFAIAEAGFLRAHGPDGTPLRSLAEAEAHATAEQARADTEARARREAEAQQRLLAERIALLEQELARRG